MKNRRPGGLHAQLGAPLRRVDWEGIAPATDQLTATQRGGALGERQLQ